MAESKNYGYTWNTKLIYDGGCGSYENPVICRNGSHISIAVDWYTYRRDLQYICSDDNGISWNTMNVDTTGDIGINPSIVSQGSYIAVSYCDYDNRILKLAESNNNGIDWNIKVADSKYQSGYCSSITYDDDSLYISYTGDYILRFCIIDKNGTLANISELCSADDISIPFINRDGDYLLIAYIYGYTINVVISDDKGQSWTFQKLDTYLYDTLTHSDVIKDGNFICVIFYVYGNERYLKCIRSQDSGQTWE